MVESCDLFFDQELPHTDRVACGCNVMVEGLVTPQCPPTALNSVMEVNENLVAETLIYCFTLRHKFMMNQTLLVKKCNQHDFDLRTGHARLLGSE